MNIYSIFNLSLSGLFIFNSGIDAVINIYNFEFLLLVYLLSIFEINMIYFIYKKFKEAKK